jgi:hypothetical protein
VDHLGEIAHADTPSLSLTWEAEADLRFDGREVAEI